jgi:hypothetical protein
MDWKCVDFQVEFEQVSLPELSFLVLFCLLVAGKKSGLQTSSEKTVYML